MIYSLPLAACSTYERTIVGGKAHTLGKLIEHGFTVPEGACWTTALFDAMREHTTLGALIKEQLQIIEQQPILRAKSVERIRDAILHIDLPKQVRETIIASTKPLLEYGSVVVRSSATLEDGAAESYAGIYRSEINLTSIDAVEEAVRQCWAALFTERALFYGRGKVTLDIALIVQTFITPLYSGVLFTLDPITGVSDDIVIELNAGGNQSITDGTSAAKRVRIAKDSTTSMGLPENLAPPLLKAAKQIEALLGGPVDIEWAWDGHQVQILQARLLTTHQRLTARTAWASQEAVDQVYALELGRAERLFMRQLQKKVWYRQFCQTHSLKTFALLYVTYTPNELLQVANELLAELHSPIVRIHWGSHTVLTPRADLVDTLIAGRHHNPIGDGTYSCAQIGDVIPAEASGFATCLASGQVFIEAFPAGVEGIKEGGLSPTTYLIDTQDKVVKEAIAAFNQRGTIDIAQGNWVAEPVATFHLHLSATELLEITNATRQLTAAFGEVRLEWYTFQNHGFVKDLSIESEAIALAGDDIVLSPGTATGVVVKITDAAAFDRLARGYEISVVSHGHDEGIYSEEAIQHIELLVQQYGDVILVADYPSIGLIPLIRSVKGFVFARSSLLCHTAIVLRERHIPAITIQAAFDQLQQGERISISDAGIIRFS